MDQKKTWRLTLILAVLAITLYNILPTLFWYSKPLKSEITPERAEEIAKTSLERIQSLENESIAWISAYTKNLGLTPLSITLSKESPQWIDVSFSSEKEARLFKRFFNQAGSLISFVPAQLRLAPGDAEGVTTVTVQRMVGIQLPPDEAKNLFTFSKKLEGTKPTAFYESIVFGRVQRLAEEIAGPAIQAERAALVIAKPEEAKLDAATAELAREITQLGTIPKEHAAIQKRLMSAYSTLSHPNKAEFIQSLAKRFDVTKKRFEGELALIQEKNAKQKESGALLSTETAQKELQLKSQIKSLESGKLLLEKEKSAFASGLDPLTPEAIQKKIQEMPKGAMQSLSLKGYNPYLESIEIGWVDDRIVIKPYSDIASIAEGTEALALSKEQIQRGLFNAVAIAAQLTDETPTPLGTNFLITLSSLTGSKSILALDLKKVAEKESSEIEKAIQENWKPLHPDLSSSNYPLRDWALYQKEGAKEKKLGLVLYSPITTEGSLPEGFNARSLYVVARGLDSIVTKYRDNPNATGNQQLFSDVEALANLLERYGFIAYPAKRFINEPEFQNDTIFELRDYFDTLVAATREAYQVHGSSAYATLELTDVEQRMLITNQIDDRIQEDLVKWEEAYQRAQVDPTNPASRFLVPPPTSSPFLANLALTAKKYVRGDDRKILKWGLDLSGGKTVRIGLKDSSGKMVTNPDDLNQAVNELYTRINRMGVSERTIRVEGQNIVLDFPGSQALSASELIKASAMYFHIVNEKFNLGNSELAPTINKFLQDVWNEAVVTNRTDEASINEIAWRHLGGSYDTPDEVFPRSEVAKVLHENGLMLSAPANVSKSSQFNDSLSMVTRLRGDTPAEWHGRGHPLLIVFNNYSVEGSSLKDVHAGWDDKYGWMLIFGVKSAYEGKRGELLGSPQQDLLAWTAEYSKERIAGTPKENYSPEGWRMAVILNGEVISAPTLTQPLSSGGTIHGKFTPREINQLVADLKAGSLSFTPKILSEENVSPELGKEERTRGALASFAALLLVALSMIGVYRFAGFIATIAVLFNLLILWGVSQSIGVAITMPGIAAIVLTIGMAIDANVLVFERIREEFAHSGRIFSAIEVGYRKAFSAIFDSNITTIMVALILLQFDSGPIKGFALTLIIGILSSMFTGLFMTHTFFSWWASRPGSKTLTMSKLFEGTKINFLKFTKPAIIASLLLIAVGSYFLVRERSTLFGMDFTGGYSLSVEVESSQETAPRLLAIEALKEAGATSGEIQVRELSRPEQLRIQLGLGMEEAGHPFHGMPQEISGDFDYSYLANPRIDWVVDALAKKGLTIPGLEKESLGMQWSSMSGQLSETMKEAAVIALLLALLGILIYITFRFEFKYAVGAVVGLVHDIWITLGVVALLHMLGVPLEFNLIAVGAIMTIIGYSLNDTIIVFDRIREDVELYRKISFEEVINLALNSTLNRTLMTSGTTLLVLLALLLFGGESIFGFSLIMFLGILIGTLSSLFIAAPVMLWVHNREKRSLKHPSQG